MKLLALDTSTAACSVALWIDNEAQELFEIANNRHSDLLLPMIERILDEAGTKLYQCDAIAFGEGPGSFTGLRIGVGVAQGLAYGADIPVIPVSSLHAQANRHPAPRSLCAFDARIGQIYWCSYKLTDGVMEPTSDIALSVPEEVRLEPEHTWVALGTGCDRYQDKLEMSNSDTSIRFIGSSFPHALDVARVAVRKKGSDGTLPAEQATPHYVRDKVTQ